MCIKKLQFCNEILATIACARLSDYAHCRLGSAIVVNCDRHNTTHVANVCHMFNGYYADVTDFDKGSVGE